MVVFAIVFILVIAGVVAVMVIRKSPPPTKEEVDPNADLHPIPPPDNPGPGQDQDINR